MMKGLINLNQKILTPDKAKISVMDHGFIYGDSVFDTLRTVSGYPLELGLHIDRLFQSAARIQLKAPLSKKEIYSEVLRTAMAYWKKYSKCDLYIRIIMSRGIGDIGLDPSLCPRPAFIIIVKKFIPLPENAYERGVSLALVSTLRNHPKSIDPNIKSGNYLNNILAYLEAKKRRAFDAVMQNEKGYLTEATVSNIFLVKDGMLLTPSLKNGLLNGLTRTMILHIAKKQYIPCREANIRKETLFSADECFISSSLKGILPVSHCDAKKIGPGKPGPLTKKLRTLLEETIQKSIREEYCLDT